MNPSSKSHRSFRLIVSAMALLAIIGAALGAHHPAQAAVVSGYSEYYLPGNARQLLLLLDDNEGDNLSASTLTNINTISAGGDAVIYYDHWENGYLNGTAGDEVYTTTKGSTLTFKSVNIPTTAISHTLTACSGSTFPAGGSPAGAANRCYDGQDRIYVSGAAVSVAQAFWPSASGVNTNYANAWEVYPVKPYQENYTIPVGEDLCPTGSPSCVMDDFDNVYVIAQATYSGTTTIQIDNPATAGVEVSKTLSRGETTELWHINSGTLITGSRPVQVQFIIAEDGVTPNYFNSRSYTAVPTSLWSWHYYSPVSSDPGKGSDADVFIYNPTTATLSLRYAVITSTATFTVAAKSTESFKDNSGFYVPAGSALSLQAVDGSTKFWAIGGYDVHNSSYNQQVQN